MRSVITRRACLGWLVGGLAAFGVSFPARSLAADAPGVVRIVRDSKDPRWVHGTVTIAAAPDAVMARLSKVDQWPQFLSDIKRMKIVEHDGSRWHVKLETRTMDCGAHDYHLNVSKRGVQLRIDATGINAQGVISVRAGENAGISVAKFSMLAETTGIIGLLIPEKKLRARQEKMVRRDLEDLSRAFSSR